MGGKKENENFTRMTPKTTHDAEDNCRADYTQQCQISDAERPPG